MEARKERALLLRLASAANLLLVTAANRVGKKEVRSWYASSLLYELLADVAALVTEEGEEKD